MNLPSPFALCSTGNHHRFVAGGVVFFSPRLSGCTTLNSFFGFFRYSGAVRAFVILQASPVVVGTNMIVWVQAQDQYQNKNPTFSGFVSMVVLSGTGVTGIGLVSITNGLGQRSVTTHVAQSVRLGLTDSGQTGLNVQSQSTVIFQPGMICWRELSSPPTGCIVDRFPFVLQPCMY